MKTKENSGLTRAFRQCVYLCLMVFAFAGASAVKADEISDSPDPILISEADSTRAMATNADWFRGRLPKESTQIFQSGEYSRAVIFVTNVDLIEGEGANAFRVYAEDARGKVYRLTVEDIAPLGKQNWIYAVTVRLYDQNGYNGQPQNDGDVLLRLTWRGMTSNRVRIGLGTTGGKVEDDADAVPTPAPSVRQVVRAAANNNAGDRTRFMQQAAFGPNPALELRLRQIGQQRWINEQFNKQPTYPYPDFPQMGGNVSADCGSNIPVNCVRDHYTQYQNQNWLFKEALYGDDQLLRRTSWALSQIWVVSGVDTQQQRHLQEYYEVLDKHAFGNYRNLMAEMTLNPAMGNYLDMMRSTRTNPNENYPREILQLFTVGLDKLNQDGTQVDGDLSTPGIQVVPTYSQDDVNNFTKVFTGWSGCNSGPPNCPNGISNIPNYIDPMQLISANHDQTAKTLFNYTQVNGQPAPFPVIPACTNCTTDANRIIYANTSLSQTLDNIFYHPNLAPFVGKLMIQHLVTSDPSPAYVARVAAAFNGQNGSPRGDMKSLIRAILLDPEARGSRKTASDYGKLREPFQLVTNILRNFDVKSADRTVNSDGYLVPQSASMGQNVWNSPTVFNYFTPDYVVPGTDLVGPEFAIMNSGTSFSRINFINTMVYNRINCNTTGTPAVCNPNANTPLGTSIDLTPVQTWAQADITANNTQHTMLIEGLNSKMLNGTMSDAMKGKLRTAINAIASTGTTAARDRARQAVYLVATSSQYQVQK